MGSPLIESSLGDQINFFLYYKVTVDRTRETRWDMISLRPTFPFLEE